MDEGRTFGRTEGGCVSGRWVDLREAAELLGTSTEAVRKRAARGSLRSDRQDGRVLVWVDEGRTEGGREAQVDREALLEAKDHTIRILEDQLHEEREARRRADTIIAQLTQANAALAQRVPELEAPPETRESPQTISEQPERGDPRLGTEGAQEPALERRGFWARLFGGRDAGAPPR
jgi:hypothetical protein